MKLYTYFRSSTSFRVRIALAYKGLDYDVETVSLTEMQHRSPDYLQVNPQGLLPAFIDDDGTLVTQSLAILEYLDARYPVPPILPASLVELTYVREISQIIACEIHPLNNIRVLNYLSGELQQSEERKTAWYQHWIAEGLSKVEDYLQFRRQYGRYCLGDTLTMADICIAPQIFNARRFHCPLDDYPVVMGIYAACMELEAFTAAEPGRQADAV